MFLLKDNLHSLSEGDIITAQEWENIKKAMDRCFKTIERPSVEKGYIHCTIEQVTKKVPNSKNSDGTYKGFNDNGFVYNTNNPYSYLSTKGKPINFKVMRFKNMSKPFNRKRIRILLLS